MTASAILELLLVGLQHTAELKAMYDLATAEKRDLTPEEVAGLKAKAMAAIEKLAA